MLSNKTNFMRLLSTLLVVLFSTTAPAQIPAAPATSSPAAVQETQPPPPIPDSLATPRATMETYLDAMAGVREDRDGAMEQALTTLDLSEINPLVRAEKGTEIAWLLFEVLERTRPPNTKKFSTRREGRPYVFQTYENGKVELLHTAHVGWRFSAATVKALEPILDELIDAQLAKGEDADLTYLPVHLRLRASIPTELRKRTLVLEHWQWLGILLIILVGLIIDKLVAALLRVAARTWRTRFAAGAFREVDDSILRPLGLMALALVWWAGLNLLSLPDGVLAILLVSVKFLACLSAVWGAYRLVDLLGALLQDKAKLTESKLDDALVPLVTKTIKVFVTVMGAVFIADNLDVDVTSLLAGLGLGGLAFALAAKDVAGNLFGSITVLLDQTFHVGDWVMIGDVEGSVERIGFRSTRVRTFYDSLVSVPNSTLITANVDNMGARSFRRLSCKFGIAYETPPDRIDAFCEGIREIVRQHPYMRKDAYHVYLNGLGSAQLDILVYVFWSVPDWGTELRERHRFLLDCLRLAERLGVEYAFPTQTLYMKQAENGLLPVAEGGYTPSMSEQDAQARGREQAVAVVGATLGLGVVPEPVNSGGGDADGE